MPWRSGAQRASRGTSTHHFGRTEARCVRSGSQRQRGGDTIECARAHQGAAAAGRGCCWARMRLVIDAAAGCCCSGAVPQLPAAPSLSLQPCVERGTERIKEASLLIPLFVLSPSLSHLTSSSLSLLPNPPLPLSMTLLNLPIHPPLPSPLPLHLHPSLRLLCIFIA